MGRLWSYYCRTALALEFDLHRYLIRRILLMIVTLWLVSLLVFLSIRLIPGNIVDSLIADIQRSSGTSTRVLDREALERLWGIDVPIAVQYGRWMGVLPGPNHITGETSYSGIFQGSLGISLKVGAPVTEMILRRFGVTFELGFLAIVIGLVIALPVGIYSAIRQDTAGDYVGRIIAIIGLSTPNFWLAMMVMLYPAIHFGWSPPIELISFKDDPLENLKQFIIPAAILGTAMSAITMRMTRTMMLEVLRQDYIRTAWSKGLRERVVVTRHALKNALIPVVTIVGGILPIMIGGAVIMETIFGLPGMGRLMIDSLLQRDYPVVSGVNLVIATAIVVANLLVDISYAYLDPRVRYQ